MEVTVTTHLCRLLFAALFIPAALLVPGLAAAQTCFGLAPTQGAWSTVSSDRAWAPLGMIA